MGLSLGLLILLSLVACTAQPDAMLVDTFYRGELGTARVYMQNNLSKDRNDRDYLLDRMRLGIVALGDGYPQVAGPVLDEVYDVLRTAGLNADRTVSSVVINEDQKIWKGEPFEQAMAYCYVAAHYAEIGSWDNTRAAALNSLFHLRDFGTAETGRRKNSEDLIRQAETRGNDYLDKGYVSRESNFALGYLLCAIANQQIGRIDEANDYYAHATEANPALEDLVRTFRGGKYNTVLIVDAGRGPQKTASGPDNAIATFMPLTPSDGTALRVVTSAGEADYPIVVDLNILARDHMWNNLEDVRIAKSQVGSLMMTAGAITGMYGVQNRDNTMGYVGLGLLAAGAFAKAGAHADTRYCEVMPQRVYVVPLELGPQDTTVTLQVLGNPASRMVVTGFPLEKSDTAVLRYIRLVAVRNGPAPDWATCGVIRFDNDRVPKMPAGSGPYILGGNSVRTPTEAVFDEYLRRGLYTDLTLSEFEDLYKAEGISVNPDWEANADTMPGRHLLEGGVSLIAPLGGKAGYTRIFGKTALPYAPKSELLRDYRQRLEPTPSAATWPASEPATPAEMNPER